MADLTSGNAEYTYNYKYDEKDNENDATLRYDG
jgi:hypothetical protein